MSHIFAHDPNAPTEVDWELVLDKIANGEVPSEFCVPFQTDMPDTPADIERKARADSAFAAQLADAKRMGAVVMLAECKKIADNAALRADQKKIQIDVRMKLAAIWNPADCREVAKTENVTTVRNLTPREEYIEQMVAMTGCDREAAAALYDRNAGGSVQ